MGPVIWSNSRRVARELYVLTAGMSLAALAKFFTASTTFNVHRVFAVTLMSILLFLAVNFAVTALAGGARAGIFGVRSTVSTAARLMGTVKGMLAVVVILSPVFMAIAFVKNRDFANTVTSIRMIISEPPQETPYTLVNAFRGVQFRRPMQIAFVPSDPSKAFVLERGGALYSLNSDGSGKQLVLNLASDVGIVDIENGAMGFAVHPDFGKSGAAKAGWIFVYYTHVEKQAQQNRLVRYDLSLADPETRRTEGVTLMALDRNISGFHNGGTVVFGPDDFLYVSVGEASEPKGHQTLGYSLFGGILRIDPDMRGGDISHPPPRQPVNGVTAQYFIPNDNPFVGRPESMEEFFAIGLRNPFRVAFDSQNGRLWAGEVGTDAWEEVNVIEKGRNYQFPYTEGREPTQYDKPGNVIGLETGPLYTYHHTANDRAVIGGAVYRGGRLADLNGRYIFGDNYSGKIWTLPAEPDPDAQPIVIARAVQVAQRGITSLTVAPDGRFLVTTLGAAGEDTGRVWSVVPTGSVEDSEKDEPKSTPGVVAMSETLETFNSVCARCHGMTGHADGPDSKEIGGKFPNFASQAYHEATSDEIMIKVIKLGGEAAGMRDAMPQWGDILSDDEIKQLVVHIRSLKKPGDTPAFVTYPEKKDGDKPDATAPQENRK